MGWWATERTADDDDDGADDDVDDDVDDDDVDVDDEVQDFKPYQAQNKGQRLNSGERQDREWYLRDFSQEDEQMV